MGGREAVGRAGPRMAPHYWGPRVAPHSLVVGGHIARVGPRHEVCGGGGPDCGPAGQADLLAGWGGGAAGLLIS